MTQAIHKLNWNDSFLSLRASVWILASLAALCLHTSTALHAQEDPSNPSAPAVHNETDHVIAVIGASGTPEYAAEFADWLHHWDEAARRNGWKWTTIGSTTPTEASDRDRLREAIAAHANSPSRLWLVLLGHGTYSAGEAKFNLVGPDVSATELAAWLAPLESPLVVINCSSASAPFLPLLSGPKRIIITATRSGSEINLSRFGKFFANAMGDLNVDVDHDLSVSLLEVFLAAASQTERFYADQALLATEHALLDDNADRAGSSSDFFQSGRVVRRPIGKAQVDGDLARGIIVLASPDAPQLSEAQLIQREKLERELAALKERKTEISSDDYYDALEKILLQLAALYKATE